MRIKYVILYSLLAFIFMSPILAHFFAAYPDVDKYYPLWKNDLFANTPYVASRFEIKIYSIDGELFEPGKPLYEIQPTLDWQNYSSSVVVDMMGLYFDQNKKKFNEMKTIFEKYKFNQFHYVEWGLMKSTWKPIDRYLNGENLEEIEISRFIYENK